MKKIFTFMMALLLGAGMLYAENEIYAVLNETDSIMTLRYDDQRVAKSGVIDWSDWKEKVKTCVLDESMKAARPDSTRNWFLNFSKLLEIQHLDYLNTEEVTTMRSMFYGCRSLASLDVSHFDTKNVTNMRSMFYYCESLTTLNLSHFNTAKVTDMSNMFAFCRALTALDLGSFNTANVTTMQWMFRECHALKTLNVSSFNTANVTNMEYMFGECKELTTLNVSHFNTAKVTNMSAMFMACVKLNSIDVGFFNTANVQYMDNMFSACKNVYTLNVANFNTDKVIGMSEMFNGCENLASIDLRNFNTDNVQYMSSMFAGCKALTTLDLSNFNTAKVTNMSYMFAGCSSLTSLDLTNFNIGKVTDTYWMFSNCTALKTIYCNDDWSASDVLTNSAGMFRYCSVLEGGQGTKHVGSPEDKTYARPDEGAAKPGYFTLKIAPNEIYAALNSVGDTMTLYFDGQKSRRSGVIAEWTVDYGADNVPETTLNAIKAAVFDASMADARPTGLHNWFKKMKNMTAIKGMENFNTSDVTNMYHVFYGCASLTSLDLSHFNTEKVTYMANMFQGCAALKELDLSSFNTEKVTSLNYIFQGCQNLATIDLSSWNTANVTNMAGVFADCNSLHILDLRHFNTDKVERMSLMFAGCINLKTILCAKDWGASETLVNSDEMFYGCTALVGEKGTTYNKNNITAAYAHPDEGTSNPGYFSTKICYIITWKMDDGTIIDQTSVEAGVVPTHADPTKPATAQYSYTFAGWTPEVVAATADATYTATFTSEVKTYDITFELKDDASKSYVAKDVAYGTTLGQLIDQVKAAFGGETYEDDQYIYTFAGLENAQMTDIITESKTYYVLYTKEAKPTTGFDQVNSQELKAKSQKLIRDGQLLIMKDGRTYNVVGQIVQ